MPKNRLVLCFGNPYVCDDGFGPQVYQYLSRSTLPADVELHELGLCGVSLLDWFDGQPLVILVDLLKLGGTPGECRRLSKEELLALAGPRMSLHQLTLPETLLLGEKFYKEQMPQKLILIGTEGICLDEYGSRLSLPVEAAIPVAAQMVFAELGME